MNVGGGGVNQVKRIRTEPSLILIRYQKQLEKVGYFSYLERKVRNDGRCTREIKSRVAIAKAAFNKIDTLFTSKLDLDLGKKLVKRYIQNISLYGAETWTLRKVHHKYFESFKMWCWRRMEKISLTNRVRNRVKEERNILHTINRRKADWILGRNCLLKHIIEGTIEGGIQVTRRK
jgi:hypothetical protein